MHILRNYSYTWGSDWWGQKVKQQLFCITTTTTTQSSEDWLHDKPPTMSQLPFSLTVDCTITSSSFVSVYVVEKKKFRSDTFCLPSSFSCPPYIQDIFSSANLSERKQILFTFTRLGEKFQVRTLIQSNKLYNLSHKLISLVCNSPYMYFDTVVYRCFSLFVF